MTEQHGQIGGYEWSTNKVDRHLDPYMGAVRTPSGYTYTGLFATMGKARAWARETITKDMLDPRQPVE